MTDEQALQIAKDIYSSVYGAHHNRLNNPNNNYFYHDMTGDIAAWIKEGDPELDYDDLEYLVYLWRKHDADTIAALTPIDIELVRMEVLDELDRRAREFPE